MSRQRFHPGDRVAHKEDETVLGTVFMVGSDLAERSPFWDTAIVMWDISCEPEDCFVEDLQSNPDYQPAE